MILTGEGSWPWTYPRIMPLVPGVSYALGFSIVLGSMFSRTGCDWRKPNRKTLYQQSLASIGYKSTVGSHVHALAIGTRGIYHAYHNIPVLSKAY